MKQSHDFIEVLMKESRMTRKQVLNCLDELESHNLVMPLTPDRDWSVGVWMPTLNSFSGVSFG
ncbi:hypothetical protein SAMN05444583_10791 [Rhodococcus maanshanensis]|uniref:Uncharacterized protein n=1 Tax=Rhodococcus maanshanensis TaxID=183556 RepID=A0A1H7NN68_9NOCA|nr:hypothetical protein SAMN05444583_10791 [Rhodococcus maanshanensis]